MFAAISNLLTIPYNWLTKILYLSICIALWTVIVGPYQADFVTFINYILNMTLYRFFPESAIIAMEQFFVLLVTFKLLVWIFNTNHYGLPASNNG